MDLPQLEIGQRVDREDLFLVVQHSMLCIKQVHPIQLQELLP